MQWLSDNCLWIVGGILVIGLIYAFTRPRRSRQISNADQAKMVGFLVAKLTEVMEHEVDDAVGRFYTRQDRQKIAVGMLTVMAMDNVTLDRIAADRALFAAVMLKSIANLTALGEIQARGA